MAWNKGKKFPYKPNYKLRGRVPWNKGLTKETDERILKHSEIGKENKRLSHLGKKHSEETKRKIGDVCYEITLFGNSLFFAIIILQI